MAHDLELTIALLSRTPAALNALLRDLPEEWSLRNEGEGTWTVFDIVGHLVYADRTDWMTRVKTILDFGEEKAFEPFDRLGQREVCAGKSLAHLLDEFMRLRRERLEDLRALNLRAEDFAKTGLHPSLGVVTLSELLATWAAHDMTHLHQIARVMAHQYREEVGPWNRFLGVLHCDGHSSSA